MPFSTLALNRRAWLCALACLSALVAPLAAQQPLEVKIEKPRADGPDCCAGLGAREPSEVRSVGRYWTVERSGTEEPGNRLEVETKGKVTVRGSDREDVRYVVRMRLSGAADEDRARDLFRRSGMLPVRRPDGGLLLVLHEPDCATCRFEARLEIEVPSTLAEVVIATRAGNVDIASVGGSVRARTMGGSIEMDRIEGEVHATTAGGSVRLGAIRGPVESETAGGSIRLQSGTGSVRLRTYGGSIRVTDVEGDLDAETAGGSIRIGRVAGALRAKTGAGDVLIDQAMGALMVSAGAGNIEAALHDGTGMRDSVLDTSVGSIVISLADSIALTLDAHAQLVRGVPGILSEFPSVEVRRSVARFGPASASATGPINGGGPVLRLRTGVGRIAVRKLR